MKHIVLLILLFIHISRADDALKLYGLVTYLAQDETSLMLGDLPVDLSTSHIEGVLSVGAAIEVEGKWQGHIFLASEVEVITGTALQIYTGQVQEGKLLGLEWEGLQEHQWLQIVAESDENHLNILLIKPIVTQRSGVKATVEQVTPDGFIAGGVQVVSKQQVVKGQFIDIYGTWDGTRLIEYASP